MCFFVCIDCIMFASNKMCLNESIIIKKSSSWNYAINRRTQNTNRKSRRRSSELEWERESYRLWKATKKSAHSIQNNHCAIFFFIITKYFIHNPYNIQFSHFNVKWCDPLMFLLRYGYFTIFDFEMLLLVLLWWNVCSFVWSFVTIRYGT